MIEIEDEPNWDLEIPLVMGTADRGALAHRIRAWGREQFAAGKAAALAELRLHWLAEKERADKLQAEKNEAAFDKLLSDPPRCAHQFTIDHAGAKYNVWRCTKCGAERTR